MKKYTPKLKIIPLGGLEEVGRNMMLLEYERDIVIVDMGLQFPEEDMPGIDYIIPNISYLQDKKNYIRGVIITHGHYDHIGAIPHLVFKLGNPTIFTARLTRAIIEKRQEEYKNGKHKLNIYTVSSRDVIHLGVFKVEFFRVNHNIPDGLGVVIHTPCGTVIHTGDFKFDPEPIGDVPAEREKIKQLGKKNNILALCSDSTAAETKGRSISEKTILENLKEVFKITPGRIIISTFSSLISRIQQVIMIAEDLGKFVAIDGYSMKVNVEIAKKLGYLKTKKHTIIPLREAKKLPDNKIVLLCTGAQGEERAILMRIASGEHKEIRIEKNDTIVFSSSVVPGNERTVQRLKDTLTRQGAKIYHYQMMDIHAGGHATEEDLKEMIALSRPKYFIPIHGNRYMLKIHGDLAAACHIPEKNIFITDNGQIIEFEKDGQGFLTEKKALTDPIMVDGLGVGDISQIVLRDRKMLAADGMLVVIATINSRTGRLMQNPDLISRGFIYMKGQKRLVEQTRKKAREIVERQDPRTLPNYAFIKNKLRDEIGQFLYHKIQRRPMVLPVVIEV
jgi:ribonuclease J